MAKPSDGAVQKPQNGKPPSAPVLPAAPKPDGVRVLTVRHLDVQRHANDDYTVAELTLVGPVGGPFAVANRRELKAHCTANVARDWVRSWYTEFTGTNLTGPYWR